MGYEQSCLLLPSGYVLTFACYGTRLHGDARETVDRKNNRYGMPFLSPESRRSRAAASRMKHLAYHLDPAGQKAVKNGIWHGCMRRAWKLHASQVSQIHVHVVLSALSQPEPVLNARKSHASQSLKRCGIARGRTRHRARGGSTVYLWTEEALANAVRYVVELQCAPMEVFDASSED